MRAAGTRSWQLQLDQALPPGRYVAYSRATIAAGFREGSFAAATQPRRVPRRLTFACPRPADRVGRADGRPDPRRAAPAAVPRRREGRRARRAGAATPASPARCSSTSTRLEAIDEDDGKLVAADAALDHPCSPPRTAAIAGRREAPRRQGLGRPPAGRAQAAQGRDRRRPRRARRAERAAPQAARAVQDHPLPAGRPAARARAARAAPRDPARPSGSRRPRTRC